MIHTRRGSHASVLGVGRTQLRHFHTLKIADGAKETTPELEVVLVHGCCNSRTHSIEKSLWGSATSIGKRIGQSRVHIFSFDAAKLLRKGKPRLDELARHLLKDIKDIPRRNKVAIIAHTSAVWVVRAAIVQSQYDNELQKVPVGLVDFGLPKDCSHEYWDVEKNWNEFRNGLLKHLTKEPLKTKIMSAYQQDRVSGVGANLASKKGMQLKMGASSVGEMDVPIETINDNHTLSQNGNYKDHSYLDFDSITSITRAFKDFRHGLDHPDRTFPMLSVACPERKGIPRTATGVSQETNSSTGSDEQSMCVRMSPDEEQEIVNFLKDSKMIPPSLIPARPKASISEEGSKGWRSSMRSVSRDRYNASYDTRSTQSSDLITRHIPTQDQELVSPQPMRHIEHTLSPTILEARLTESPQPLESAFRKPGPTSRRATVEFVEKEEQRGYSVSIPRSESEKKKSFERNFKKNLEEKNLKESKGIASWYLQNGDVDEAEDLYNDLIDWCYKHDRLDRGYWKMKLQIGQIRYIRGDYESSEKQLDISLKGAPKEVALTTEIARWLALSQWRQGKYTHAQKTLYGCIQQLPEGKKHDPRLLSILALVLASSGSLTRAWKLSTQAISHQKSQSSGLQKDEDALSGQRGFCLVNHARISSVVGKLDEADEVNRKALQSMEKHLGPKHFITLDASSLQAWLLVARSKTSQAAQAAHRTLHEMRERFAGDHPLILQTLETLVLVYKSEGRYSDAEETAAHLFSDNKRKLGDNHPQTLKSQSILAEIQLSCGKWRVAEEMQRRAVELEEKRVNDGIDYLGLYSYKTTLANILRESGKWDEARTLSLDVLVEQLNKFGHEDEKDDTSEQEQKKDGAPDVNVSHEELPLSDEYIDFPRLHNLLASYRPAREILENLRSSLYRPSLHAQRIKIYPSIVQILHCLALCEQVRDDADLEFAYGVLWMVYEIRLKRLKEDHRLTVNVQYDIAVNHRLQGKLKESLSLIRDVVAKRRDTLGADHPDYLCAKHQEAVTLFQIGQRKQALQEQRQTLKAQEYLLGKTHSDTLLSRYTLGGFQHSLNSLQGLAQADKLLDEVIKDQINSYGENHPLVIRSRARHALILLDKGLLTTEESCLQAARKEQQIVVEQRIAQYEQGKHPTYLGLMRSARNDLAQIIQASGKPQDLLEALNMYEDLVQTLPASGGGIAGFEVRSNLASCHFKLGNYREAEAIQRKIYHELKTLEDPTKHREGLVASTFNLALTVYHISQNSPSRLAEACGLLKKAYDCSRDCYEKDHPQTVELYTTLCDWQSKLEKQKANQRDTEMIRDSGISVGLWKPKKNGALGALDDGFNFS